MCVQAKPTLNWPFQRHTRAPRPRCPALAVLLPLPERCPLPPRPRAFAASFRSPLSCLILPRRLGLLPSRVPRAHLSGLHLSSDTSLGRPNPAPSSPVPQALPMSSAGASHRKPTIRGPSQPSPGSAPCTPSGLSSHSPSEGLSFSIWMRPTPGPTPDSMCTAPEGLPTPWLLCPLTHWPWAPPTRYTRSSLPVPTPRPVALPGTTGDSPCTGHQAVTLPSQGLSLVFSHLPMGDATGWPGHQGERSRGPGCRCSLSRGRFGGRWVQEPH